MEHKATQIYGIGPEELTQKIIEGVEKRLGAFEQRICKENPSKYISRKEVAKKLNVTYVTLDTWDKKGVLKKRKIGNKVFYLNEEIEKILESSVA